MEVGMNRWIQIGLVALGVAMAGALAFGSLAYAMAPEAGRGPGGGNAGNRGRGQGSSDSSLVAIAAQVLGLNQTDLVAELNTGKTIANIATEKGVDPAKIVDAFLAPRAADLQADVAAGRLTQSQADTMLANMRISVTAQINAPFQPNGAGNGNGQGDGICDGTGS
jgi:hypothetical protein